ncbi:hypothetical protein BsWGS_23148 [Bradybaena similaris]
MSCTECGKKWQTWRKYTVILGGIFIYLPIGVPWYFGNLATYINSFYHSRAPYDMDLVDPQWIFSAFFITFSLAITASGYLSNMYGPRLTVLAALLIHSSATFLSYYAIQHSMIALITVFGAIGGLGAGLAYGPPLPVVIRWMPHRVGLASGALMTGFGGGAVFYNELITFFINPDNVKADLQGIRTKYFSQPEIIKRIPEVFLVLGALTVILQLIGVLLLRLPAEGDEIETVEMQEERPIIEARRPTKSLSNDAQTKPDADDPAVLDVNNSRKSDAVSLKDVQIVEDTGDKTPWEVLKTLNFYILWFVLAFNHYGYIIKNNYYKEFGQLRIDNDHFLTTAGTIATIGVSVARLFWGIATDWVGTKVTLLLFTGSTTIVSAFYYFSLYSPGLYMTAVIILSAAFTGAFILIPLAALRCFGEKHYAINYGLILSSQIVLNLISPPIISQILLYFGWFWLFYSIAIVNAIGTVILLFLRGLR